MTEPCNKRSATALPIDYDAGVRRAWYDQSRVMLREMSCYEKNRRPIMFDIAFDRMEALLRSYVQAYETAYFTKRSSERFSIKDAESAIDLFLEYRDKHGHSEAAAKAAAVNEFADAAHFTPAQQINLDALVDRFLSWPLPDSVCCDLICTKQSAPHRIGTNLLTAVEAKAMLTHILRLDQRSTPSATE